MINWLKKYGDMLWLAFVSELGFLAYLQINSIVGLIVGIVYGIPVVLFTIWLVFEMVMEDI